MQYNDPELYNLIKQEEKRQRVGIELIASENDTSQDVLECLGSILTNKYSEGLPHARYYGGNQYIDKIEELCMKRALEAFSLDPQVWGVNVQPYSGSIANIAAYTALLEPHQRLMGLDLPSGGHLTHGFYTSKRKISATSIFWESMPYKVGIDGYIDYDDLENKAQIFLPKLIICGASAYSRILDFKKFHQIADSVGAYLMCDMAHIAGLVATGEHPSPFDYCDIVTTTTHKTLRGPRAGMIFYKLYLADKINNAVFPAIQGGPHNNQIAAVATQLLQVVTPEFKKYIQYVKENAKILGECLCNLGYNIVSGGTDNHLLLVDLRNKGITGSKVEKICEMVGIYINKNAVPGDKSAMTPGGIRIGTPYVTTKGYTTLDMNQVALFLHRAIELGIKIQEEYKCKLLKPFIEELERSEQVKKLKQEILEWLTLRNANKC